MLRLTITLVCMFLIFQTASAEQSGFAYSNSRASHNFSFQWQLEEQSYHLEFSIDNALFDAMPTTRPAFSNDMLQRHMEIALLQNAKNLDVTQARVEVFRRNQELQYRVISRDKVLAQQTLDNLEKQAEESRLAFLDSNYFTPYESAMGIQAIKHDHAKYAANSVDGLMPVVEAIKEMQANPNDSREFIAISLSWIQSIPYDTLESRVSSNGAGYVSPRDLLTQNKGDCDSKTTLLAALLRAYSASVRQHLVLLPEHALLAVAIRPKPEDTIITQDGVKYVLLEAVGPAYFAIGEVADTSLMGVRNRQYTLELM